MHVFVRQIYTRITTFWSHTAKTQLQCSTFNFASQRSLLQSASARNQTTLCIPLASTTLATSGPPSSTQPFIMWPLTNNPTTCMKPGKGPFHVACSDIMCDHTIDGSFCRLFYPTNSPAQQLDKSLYTTWLPSKDYARGYAKFIGFDVSAPVASMALSFLLDDYKVPAIWNAPLATEMKDKMPLIIFSHGLGACRTAYSSTCTELASRGFMVAAVEHRDRSACATYVFKEVHHEEDEASEGARAGMVQDWIPHNFAKPNEDFELRNNQVTQRAEECTLALNLMEKLNKGEEIINAMNNELNTAMFKDKFDMDKVAIAGHSFGGATSLVSLVNDDRFKFGVIFDAWLYPIERSMYPSITKPLLFINTETFHWQGNIARMHRMVDDFEKPTDDRRVITILGTCHQNQSDFSLLVSSTLGKLLKTRGKLDPHIAMEINNGAAVAFICKQFGLPFEEQLESYLNGENKDVMVGTNVKLDVNYKKSGEKKQQETPEKSQANL
ncbi:platelet-activating factor acetylhydrolase 2, cytoplasmic-like isoform X2 [Amphiura filiformis]|uniref:platelet-activating factor acetylhydrolase 2, cytoplasmic-like isoform X2 n=1 Tax=Amphiura filiformis TaxID=82378 RepID=UPI003B21BEB7